MPARGCPGDLSPTRARAARSIMDFPDSQHSLAFSKRSASVRICWEKNLEARPGFPRSSHHAPRAFADPAVDPFTRGCEESDA